jgi:hypothetical protein
MRPITDMTDPEGRPLVSAKGHDPFRQRAVWAVYKIHTSRNSAEARNSDFVALGTAKATADALNRSRVAGEPYYFRAYRLATPLLVANSR